MFILIINLHCVTIFPVLKRSFFRNLFSYWVIPLLGVFFFFFFNVWWSLALHEYCLIKLNDCFSPSMLKCAYIHIHVTVILVSVHIRSLEVSLKIIFSRKFISQRNIIDSYNNSFLNKKYTYCDNLYFINNHI